MILSRRPARATLLVLAVVGALLPLVGTAPVQAAGTTLSFVASQDAYVSSASPKTKFGPAKQLRVSGVPVQRTYLRFKVTGIKGPVSNATLTLRPTAAADVPIDAHTVTGAWKESDLTYDNAPAPGAVVGTASTVPAARFDIDVTSAVTKDATIDLALTVAGSAAGSSTVAELNSREVKNLAPTLTVTYTTPDTTAPSAPTGLTATAGDAGVALTWKANSEADLAGYRVYRRVTGSTPWASIRTVAAGATSYADSGLQNGTGYDYRVTAVDTSNNESNPSATVSATPQAPADTTAPAAPTGLSAVAGDGTVTVSWQKNGESDLAGYNVYRKVTGTSSWVTIQTLGAGTTTYTDSGLQNGTGYDYQLAAFDSRDNVSAASGTVSATPTAPTDRTAPAVPTGLSASAGDTMVTISWKANTEKDLAGYVLYRQLSSGGTWARIQTVDAGTTTYTDSGLKNGTGYDYQLTAVDGSGNESAPSSTASATPKDTTAPAAPLGLEAAPGDGTVSLDWTANDEADLDGYRIYRRLSGTSWSTTPVKELAGSTTTYLDTGLTNGTSYEYRITAFDLAGNESQPSLSLAVAPSPQTDVMAPAAPIGLTATAGDSTVTLAWQANTEPDLAGYRVYRRVTGGSWPGQLLTSPIGTSYVDVSAANDTSYDYRITAVDTTGNESSPSAPATARPVPSGPCAASSSYASAVLGTPGLAAYWRLGDTTGTTACDAVGTSPGTYNGSYVLGSAGAISGDGNTALTLNGTTGYVKVPSTTALNPVPAISIEAWVAPTSAAAQQTIIRKDNQYVLRLQNGTLFAKLWWSDGTTTTLSGTTPITTGYQQVGLTYDGTAIRLFRNGVVAGSQAAAKALKAGTNAAYLGFSSDGGSGYDILNGRLDEVSLYGTALSDATISSHYRAGAGSSGGTGPAAGPDQLNAVGAPGSVGLSWTAVANATAYRVYQRAANGSWGSPIATTSTPSYAVRGLVDGQGYAFQVTAVVSGAETAASPTAQAAATDNVLLTAGDIADSTFRSEKTAQLLDRNPGQVMMLGDSTYTDGTAAEYQNYYAPTWGRQLWRTRAAVGNHEYYTDSGNPYWDYFGSAAGPRGTGWYSYDQAGWHVVVLNSNCGKVGGCNAGSAQEQWLKADLARSTAQCTVAVWHHPRFSSTSPGAPDDTYLDFWNDLMDAGVEIVLNGHDHAYERFAPQTPTGTRSSVGVRQFTVGTGGRSEVSASASDPNSQIRISDTFGVLRLDLQAGGYSWKFLPVDGSTATDSGTDTCH